MQQVAYLGLGSNLDDRHAYLNSAIQLLDDHPEIDVTKSSKFHDTKALTDGTQAPYLNAAIEVKTSLEPRALLKATQDIESDLGRTQKGELAPRTIDIDILFVGDHVICEDDLTVPHPLVHQRAFALLPLKEIAPDLIHPMEQKSVTELVDELPIYTNLHSLDDMATLAQVISDAIMPGDHLFLKGEIGVGKTTFVRSLAECLGAASPISSPSFTIANDYDGPQKIVHLDLYRLGSIDQIVDLDLDLYLDNPDKIAIVEWAEKLENHMPEEYLSITFSYKTDPNSRGVKIDGVGGRYVSLLGELKEKLLLF